MSYVIVNVGQLHHHGASIEDVHYCGRGYYDRNGEEHVSALGNPYRAGDFGGPGRTLPFYRKWLWEQIQAGDEDVLAELRAIGNEMCSDDVVLACHCPTGSETCHCNVVAAAAKFVHESHV